MIGETVQGRGGRRKIGRCQLELDLVEMGLACRYRQ